MSDTTDSSDSYEDIQIKLEHHRHILQSITTRSIRVVQFNLLVFSVFAGLLSFSRSPDEGIDVNSLATSPWALIGFIAILIGVAAGVRTVVYESYGQSASLRLLDGLMSSSGPDAEELLGHYRKRIRKSGTWLLVSYGFSFPGIILVLGGIVETAEMTVIASYMSESGVVSLDLPEKQPIGAILMAIGFIVWVWLSHKNVLDWTKSPSEDH